MINTFKSFFKTPFTNSPYTIDITSSALKNGIFLAQFGASSTVKLNTMPLISIPLKWSNYPKETKYFAITLIDNDTVPIIGFPWIHWLVANIPVSRTSLPPDASRMLSHFLLQGLNSFSDDYSIKLKELKSFQVPKENASCYGGFVPVNFPHLYTVTIYALSNKLDLNQGFTYNQLQKVMLGNILALGTLTGLYKSKITYL